MKRILSIDGGGIRGVIPAMVLIEIEERTGKPIAQLFDLVAGTSTGGILACGLCVPDGHGAPKFAAKDLLDVYVKDGPTIFPHHVFQRIRAVFEEKYPSSGIESVLQRYTGDTRLSQVLADVFVTAYDIERRKPKFFRSRDARTDPTRDCPLWMVARSTSAAPTYFEPFKLPGPNPGEYQALVDGGVFANNPAMCAYVDDSTGPGRVRPDEILLVSLGTGAENRPIKYSDAKDWGQLQWSHPILGAIFAGVSATTDYQVAQILGEDDYFRFQTELTLASDDMDLATPENIANLQAQARKLLADSAADLDRLCRRLTA
ncbi:MAG TPA: patatin-like phospholipase family protein [Candidatus Dormibacteraeota bacterium]|nr:patatin-like phospholipase family protein [Candidatus Dormibacteraeota bacterium]